MSTINKTARDTDFWLNEDSKRNENNKNSPQKTNERFISGPGYYNANKFPQKESFNYGKIPFGTGNL